SVRSPDSAPAAPSSSSSAGPSSCASVRSTTSTAPGGGGVPARRCLRRAASPISSTWWPAAARVPSTCEPNSRSATSASTSAIALLRPQAAKFLAHRLRPAPHLRHLDPSAARLAHDQLALDAGVVEQLQRAVHRGSGGGVTEAVRDEQAPVPVVVGVGLRVARDQVHGRFHVARLIPDAQVELEVGPVV